MFWEFLRNPQPTIAFRCVHVYFTSFTRSARYDLSTDGLGFRVRVQGLGSRLLALGFRAGAESLRSGANQVS